MINIQSKTLESLEFPLVLQEISSACITALGEEKVLAIVPFSKPEEINPELIRVKEFAASLSGDNGIPNHGFEAIEKELFLLDIENSSLEVLGFRRILSVTSTTQTLIKFFKKFETFYIYLNSYSESITYNDFFSEEIVKIIDKYGLVRDDASSELSVIRKRLKHVKGKINSSFLKSLSTYIKQDYLDDIKESIVDNRRVLAVKAMYRRKIRGTVLGNSKTGSIVYMEPQETLEYSNELSNLLYEEQEEIKKILKDCGSIENALLELSKSDDPQAQFLWSVHRDVFHYTAFHLEYIAETARCVDLALKSGFAWQKGIFEQVQITGWSQVRELLNKDLKEGKTLSSQALPAWVMDQPFVYSDEGAFDPNKSQFIPRSSHPVYERHLNKALLNGEKQNQFDILIDAESTKLIDIGNGIASVSFKTKMNVLSSSVLTELPECLDYLENNGFHALVFRQEQEHFCAGANLYEVISAVKLGLLEKDPGIASKAKKKAFEVMHPELPKLGKLYSIKKTVRMLQDLLMRLKHGKILTIAAVDGLALGGGCELLLHCNKVVASMNSYIGLVEVGIGALPAGCGSKEMALRAYLNKESDDIFPLLSKHFEQIAMAKVSASALEAREMGYLTSEDVIIANPNELLYVAKHQALAMLESGFRPPLDDTFKVVGKAGHANIMAQVANLFEGHFMSEHDKYCISSLAKVMTGSLVEENTVVNSKMILDLERKYFVELLGTQKTQDRIEYMLRNSKPLRN
mgnify:CR=1 FL=1